MKTLNKGLLLGIACTSFIVSCSKREINIPLASNANYAAAANTEAIKFADRNIVGAALAKAVSKSASLRLLIKTMAANRFDGNTEILYGDMVAKTIDGIGLNDYIKQFSVDKNAFQTAVDRSPLLTVFVPKLPSNWNVDIWDAQSEIPYVGIEKNCLDNKRVINIYAPDGTNATIGDTLVPGSPTIALKENNRICLKDYADLINRTYSTGSDFPVAYEQINGQQLYFITQRLKNTSTANNNNNNLTSINRLPPNVRTNTYYTTFPNNNNFDYTNESAYDMFRLDAPRDFVYYGMTIAAPWNPTPSGSLNNHFAEFMRYFWFTSTNSLASISQETYDPQLVNSKSNPSDATWTQGDYRLTFTIQVNAKNGIGTTIQKTQYLLPDSVWTVQYVPHYNYTFWGGYITFIVNSIAPRKAPLIDVNGAPFGTSILPFDLNNYSTAWKISIEDTRPTQVFSATNTFVSQFAVNFSIDGLTKIGLKFGASATLTSTQTHTVTTTTGSIALGDIVINYSDPIITSVTGSSPYVGVECYDYSTGAAGLSIIPQRQY